MNARISEEQLSAYLDGQLGPAELQRVETALAESPTIRGQLDGLIAARDAIGRLPKVAVGRDLTNDIFAEITRRSSSPAASAPALELRPTPAGRIADRQRRQQSQPWRWIGMAIAAALVGLLAIPVWFAEPQLAENDAAVDQSQPPAAASHPNDASQPNGAAQAKTDGDDPSPKSQDDRLGFTELMGTGEKSLKSENLAKPQDSSDRKRSGLRIKITSNPPSAEDPAETMPKKPIGSGAIARTTPNLTQSQDSAFDRFAQPGRLSSDERKDLLSLITSDNQKEVSDVDMLSGLRKLTELRQSNEEERISRLLSKLDLNDDNQLERREIASCLAQARFRETETGRQAARIFYRIDDNHDGVWTIEEVTKNVRLAGGPDQEFARKTRIWDQNHDGVVNFVEAEFSASALQREFQSIEGKLFDSQLLAQAQRLIATFNRSGDDSLSGRELTRALESPEVAAAAQGRKTLTLHQLYLHLETKALGL